MKSPEIIEKLFEFISKKCPRSLEKSNNGSDFEFDYYDLSTGELEIINDYIE